MLKLPPPEHMPCQSCGTSVARGARAAHVCDEARKIDYELFQLRGETAGFAGALAKWLETPQGRFEVFDAERRR
jgi:hypothetical protein